MIISDKKVFGVKSYNETNIESLLSFIEKFEEIGYKHDWYSKVFLRKNRSVNIASISDLRTVFMNESTVLSMELVLTKNDKQITISNGIINENVWFIGYNVESYDSQKELLDFINKNVYLLNLKSKLWYCFIKIVSITLLIQLIFTISALSLKTEAPVIFWAIFVLILFVNSMYTSLSVFRKAYRKRIRHKLVPLLLELLRLLIGAILGFLLAKFL
jgi:hypothetical protein